MVGFGDPRSSGLDPARPSRPVHPGPSIPARPSRPGPADTGAWSPEWRSALRERPDDGAEDEQGHDGDAGAPQGEAARVEGGLPLDLPALDDVHPSAPASSLALPVLGPTPVPPPAPAPPMTLATGMTVTPSFS
jgi:hypothetical protein